MTDMSRRGQQKVVNEPGPKPAYVFDGFRLDAQRRVLFGVDGQPIPLTPRLFDTLLYFVERAGQLLTKERLMEAIWPRVVVEEHNLNKTVSELRRVLGEKPGEHRFIVTKPGHGYRFVANVSVGARAADIGADESDPAASALQPAASIVGSKRRLMAVSLAAAALVLLGIWVYVGEGAAPVVQLQEPIAPVAQNSVAVLPFVDNSSDDEQAWLADGLTEEIINSLARLPELKVTARTSSLQFKNAARDIREIATRLGVENVLEGSVQSVGDGLRVTAQLIRAADGFHIWSNTYDGTMSDLFTFQRDVAERVAIALDVVLDESRRTAMFASGTQDVEAFREYQEGWRIYNLVHAGQTQQTLWDANRHFERATELDPRFALAAVGRTDAFAHYLVEPGTARIAHSPFSRDEALELLRRNFDFISDNSPTATMRLAAQIHRESFSPTWDRMPFLLAQLRQEWDVNALILGSGVDGALWLPNILWATGQQDLVRSLSEYHVTNDPLSVDAWIRRVFVEIHARDFDAAREVVARARRNLGPSGLPIMEFRIALLEGDRAKAIEATRLVPTGEETTMVVAAMHGEYVTAMNIADELEKRLSGPPLGPHWGGLLYTYYEVGAAERASVLVKRIDESLAGTPIFLLLLAQNGGQSYFDFKDAPNFVARLARARIDPASFPAMPRLSTLN